MQASAGGGAEQVAVGILHQGGIGVCPVVAGAGEAFQGRGGVAAAAVGREFEHRAVAVGAAQVGGAEQVSLGVGDQTGIGVGAVVAGAGKAFQRCRGVSATAVGRQLKHGAIIVRAALVGRAEQVSLGVHRQTAEIRICSVRTDAGEAFERLCGEAAAAGVHQFEHGSQASGSTLIGRAEQVTVLIGDQPGQRRAAVIAEAAEALQNVGAVSAAAVGHQGEHGANGIRPAIIGRAEEIALPVGKQPGIHVSPVGAVEAFQRGQGLSMGDTGRCHQ